MPVEIDETELGRLHSYEKVARALNTDARTRERYLELIKTLSPNTAMPEIDAKREVMGYVAKTNETMAALQKKLEESQGKLGEVEKTAAEWAAIRKEMTEEKTAREKATQDDKLSRHIDKGRLLLRDKQYTEDGISAVEKLMQERGLADYEAAEALFARTQPPAEIAMPGASQRSWDLFEPEGETTPESQKLLLQNKDKWVRGEIPKILADVRGQARRA